MSNYFKIKDYDTLVKELQAKPSIRERFQYWYDEIYEKVINLPEEVNLSDKHKEMAIREILTPILKHEKEPFRVKLYIPESIWIKFFKKDWKKEESRAWYY